MDLGPATAERGPPVLVAAIGAGRAGALAVLRPSLVPELVTEVPLLGEVPLTTHLDMPVAIVWPSGVGLGVAWSASPGVWHADVYLAHDCCCSMHSVSFFPAFL